jgi:hypothetical protein
VLCWGNEFGLATASGVTSGLSRTRDVRCWHIGDMRAARFSVRFRDLFGHRRVGRACRRMTHTVDKLGNVQRTSSNGIDPLRISSTTS